MLKLASGRLLIYLELQVIKLCLFANVAQQNVLTSVDEFRHGTLMIRTSLMACWSGLLPTRHEVPGSIPGPAVGIFPNSGRSPWSG
jgi:hypothetical protein